MLSLTPIRNDGTPRLDSDLSLHVQNTVGGQLRVNGEVASQFLQRDIDNGVVEFLQQEQPRRMHDGSSSAGFEFTVFQDGHVSKPMFFPISVIEDKQIKVPQVKLIPFCIISYHPAEPG